MFSILHFRQGLSLNAKLTIWLSWLANEQMCAFILSGFWDVGISIQVLMLAQQTLQLLKILHITPYLLMGSDKICTEAYGSLWPQTPRRLAG